MAGSKFFLKLADKMRRLESEMEVEYRHINEELKLSAAKFKDKDYIVSLDQEKTLTFNQLEVESRRIADFMQCQGVKKNDKITLIAKNSIEAMIIFFGVLRYGAIINPINSDESTENIIKIIKRVKPEIVLHDSETELKTDFSSLKILKFSEKEKSNDPFSPFFSMVEKCKPCFERPLGTNEDIAEILFTSGTTEDPKGVAISREALFYMGEEVVEKLALGPEERLLEYRAYSWASTQLLSIISTMKSGTTLLLAKKFSRSRFAQWLKKNNVTISSGVPAVINMLINKPIPITARDVPALKYITSSSAPLSIESHVAFEKLYGIPINQMAGMTEAGWMMGNPPSKRKIGSVGPPFKYKKVHVKDENGNHCESGAVGELLISGKSMGMGYLNDEDGVDAFPDEGFSTGDLGYMDEDGYVFITGRKKELIIRGGVNISPREITDRILTLNAVKDAVTFGIPDKIYGEDVACVVVPKNGCEITAAAVVNHCRETLPEFKIPKVIYFCDQIPLNNRGKISIETIKKKLKK
jgi:acyl-coenzyme A synthetase/AMP-(fatty) acid ligase